MVKIPKAILQKPEFIYKKSKGKKNPISNCILLFHKCLIFTSSSSSYSKCISIVGPVPRPKERGGEEVVSD